MWETWVRSLGREDPLEKGTVFSRILDKSTESQRAGHDWATCTSMRILSGGIFPTALKCSTAERGDAQAEERWEAQGQPAGLPTPSQPPARHTCGRLQTRALDPTTRPEGCPPPGLLCSPLTILSWRRTLCFSHVDEVTSSHLQAFACRSLLCPPLGLGERV